MCGSHVARNCSFTMSSSNSSYIATSRSIACSTSDCDLGILSWSRWARDANQRIFFETLRPYNRIVANERFSTLGNYASLPGLKVRKAPDLFRLTRCSNVEPNQLQAIGWPRQLARNSKYASISSLSSLNAWDLWSLGFIPDVSCLVISLVIVTAGPQTLCLSCALLCFL